MCLSVTINYKLRFSKKKTNIATTELSEIPQELEIHDIIILLTETSSIEENTTYVDVEMTERVTTFNPGECFYINCDIT